MTRLSLAPSAGNNNIKYTPLRGVAAPEIPDVDGLDRRRGKGGLIDESDPTICVFKRGRRSDRELIYRDGTNRKPALASSSSDSDSEDTDWLLDGRSFEVQVRRFALNQAQLHERFQFVPNNGTTATALSSAAGRRKKGPEAGPLSVCLDGAFHCLSGVFPILLWLPKYEWKADILFDFFAGLSVAVMHIPQGMAYAVLASVPPIVGLYTAFFPIIIYILMGTMPHVSFGTFAVISILVSKPILEYSSASVSLSWLPVNASSGNVSALPPELEDGDPFPVSRETETPLYSPVEVMAAVTFSVGALQFLFGLLRLDTLCSLLSDALLSGFVVAASFHVLSSQIASLIGIRLPGHVGPFKLLRFVYSLSQHVGESNPSTCLLSLCFLVLLMFYDLLCKSRVDRLLRGVAFPFQLICVILGTALGNTMKLDQEPRRVSVVGKVPTGLPHPSPPPFSLLPAVLSDSLVIAIVTFVISFSLGKISAKRHGYQIKPNQELLAQGTSNLFGAFFSSLPMSGSLSRTVIQENVGCRSLITSVVSVSFLFWVLLFVGPLLEKLPNAVLSAIIVVALKGTLRKMSELVSFARHSYFDGFIWGVTFLSTLLIDIDYGLMIGASVNIVYLLTWSLRPPQLLLLAETEHRDLNLSARDYQDVVDNDYYLILRLSGLLNFANCSGLAEQIEEKLASASSACASDIESKSTKSDDWTDDASRPKYVLLELTGLSWADPAACKAIVAANKSLKRRGVRMAIVGLSGTLWKQFETCEVFDHLSQHRCFPTLQDALTLLDAGRQRSLATKGKYSTLNK